MSISRIWRNGAALLAAVLVLATPALAAVAPARTNTQDKSSLQQMLDARVNLPAAFQQAISARPGATNAARAALRQRSAITAAVAGLQKTMPGLQARLFAGTGAPDSVSIPGGALTGEAPGRPSADIVREFLSAHRDLYGLSAADLSDLVVIGDSPGGSTHLRMLRMEQQIEGRPVFQSETRFLLDGNGRLTKSLGRMMPHARAVAPPLDSEPALGPAEAVARLLAFQGHAADAARFTVESQENGRIRLAEDDDLVAGSIDAREVLFPLAPGVLVRAWSLVVFTSGDADWYAVVDAETGALLWRKNIRAYSSTQDARFRVYTQPDGITPADSPAPMSPTAAVPGGGTQAAAIAPTVVSMQAAMDATASPNGWINDCPGGICTANETQTLGNNVLACLDQVQGGNANVCDTAAATVLDGNGRPTGNPDGNARNRDFLGTAPRDFETNYLPPPQGGNPEAGQTATGNGTSGTAPIDQFRRGTVTNLFYVANWYHDQLFKLGFDEASGNFQQTNFSGMGLGNDRVNADAADGSGVSNANFSTPPDGSSGRMQMYRFTGATTINRDGSLDAEVMIHELTHGTSNRLVGNALGLNWDPARGMGEGWSDFYALSLLNNTNADDPNGRYATGAYATYKLIAGFTDNYVYGIRRFPYSTDNSVDPLTWADVDDVTNNLSGGIPPSPVGFNNGGGFEVHNIGEIWALTLWEMRSRIIADPAGANGDVPTGNQTSLQLVTDSLKMTPDDPTFTDARDAILDTDCATLACAHENLIWDAFADRGLGYGSAYLYPIGGRYTLSHGSLKESFDSPYLDVANPLTDVTIDDSATNNNSAIDPGETLRVTIKLTNPWRGASHGATAVTAVLTTITPGVTIYDGSSAYPTIAAQGSASGDTYMFGVAPSLAAGDPLDFTLTVSSSLGTKATTFRLRVGIRNGTDPVVTYTNSTPVTIVSNLPKGTISNLSVADDFEIADLDFRLDSVTTVTAGDLSFLLRSPDAVGTDLVTLIDGLNDLGGTAITNMVMDDDVPNDAAHDMVQATLANTPYTGSWLPVFNAQWAGLVDPTRPGDPIGSLSRYDGRSTKGTWSVEAADLYSSTNGGTNGNSTLSSWSILVTPVHFDAGSVVPAVVVAATKTVSGTFEEGGTVTYTVTLTNNGTLPQLDNAGDEFTDVLPAGLALVSASASSGTAVATVGTNTVTWNGTLAPLGGSVTITITATVNSGTGGTAISNQGAVNYDADGNGTNESTVLTDDPSVGGPADPTSFVVALNFAPGDFNGDGKADILWRWQGASGEVYTWSLTGSNPMTIGSFAQITPTVTDTTWEIVGTNDFDADKDTDILWRNNATGDNIVWFMTGTTVSSGALLPAVPPDWQIKGTGDFNGDTKPDILWQNVTSRDLIIWYMDGTTVQGGVVLGAPSPVTDTNWQIGGAGDFNGDGKADIVWHNVASGDIVIWYMDGGTVTGGAVLAISVKGWKLTGIGDINGDGDPDILWRNQSGGGELIVWFMANEVITGGDFITPAVSDQKWQVEGPQ